MKRFLQLLALAIFFSACATQKNTDSNNLNGQWQLTIFPAGGKSFEEGNTPHKPQINFTGEPGKVTGHTGCNRFSTTYTLNGNQISFDKQILSTKMACINYDESAFINALLKVNGFKKSASSLTFMQGTDVIMTFTPLANSTN